MESMDEEIRSAMEVEIRRLTEEEEVEKKKLMERKEIRDIRFKSVLNISPLEIIIDNANEEEEDGYLNVVENINQIELVIDAIDHYYIYQYWSPPSTTSTTTANSLCQHHDYHHPRDDDDEDMILTSCWPLCDPPRRIKFSINQGVFTSDHTDVHIMSTLLRDVGILFEYDFLYTLEQLEDVKRSITCRISEAKAHVLRARPFPKKVRICVDISQVAKKYYRSAEVATFVAAMDAAIMASSSTVNTGDAYCVSYTNIYNTKRASRLSKKALRVKTIEKEDLLLIMGNNNNNSSYSCQVCWNEFSIGVDIVMIMPCSHMFHCECLHNWLRERNSCPLCRFELPIWNQWNNNQKRRDPILSSGGSQDNPRRWNPTLPLGSGGSQNNQRRWDPTPRGGGSQNRFRWRKKT